MKVTFLVPASPTPAFLSQIAGFQLALRRLPWTRWEPTILASFGDGLEGSSLAHFSRWARHLPDATAIFPHKRPTDGLYDGQIDELYRSAPVDADVLVRIDADVLPAAPLEPILDYVLERSAMAGVIAHYLFPTPAGTSNRDAWQGIEHQFVDHQLRFDYSYSLMTADAPAEERATPFYLNEGCVFIAREYFEQLAPIYLDTRPRIAGALADPYFAGQVALAVAAAQIPLPAIALPLRYNFPNDLIAARLFPEEMEAAVVIHYLRLDEFDRQEIFRCSETYGQFLSQPLHLANERFRAAVRELLGDNYPFGSEAGASAPPSSIHEPILRSVAATSEPDPHTLADPWVRERLESLGSDARVLDVGAGRPSESQPYDCVFAGALAQMPREQREELIARLPHLLKREASVFFVVDLLPKSDFLHNRVAGVEREPPEAHGSILDVVAALESAGLRVTERTVRRTLPDCPSDVLLIEATLAPADG